MEIKLLKFLEQHPQANISAINAYLEQTSIDSLSQIGRINQQNPGLIEQSYAQYTISQSLNWLNPQLLSRYLKLQDLDYSVKIIDQITSTNSYILNHVEQFPHHSILSCEWQFAGRGRFGRRWLTKIAHDLTVSLVYILPLSFNLALIPTICAVALNRMLKNHSLSNFIKWPNDIYYQGTKVAGILVENLVRLGQNHTVIGIGLDNFHAWERNKLLSELVATVDNVLHEYEIFGFALLRREWLDNCAHWHKEVIIKQGLRELTRGIHTDISETGELIIKDNAGNYNSFASSVISLELSNSAQQ